MTLILKVSITAVFDTLKNPEGTLATFVLPLHQLQKENTLY